HVVHGGDMHAFDRHRYRRDDNVVTGTQAAVDVDMLRVAAQDIDLALPQPLLAVHDQYLVAVAHCGGRHAEDVAGGNALQGGIDEAANRQHRTVAVAAQTIGVLDLGYGVINPGAAVDDAVCAHDVP